MSTRQLARALGVSESSVKRWVDDGEITAERTAGGHRRISVSSAMSFLRTRRVRPTSPGDLPLSETPDLGVVDAASSDALYEALLEDEAPAARGIICGRFMSGAGVGAIGDGLLRPVLERIGELWKDDPRGILIEHRAVQSCSQALAQIAAWLPEPDVRAPVAVTAAGPADPYLLPPLLASMTLRESGMRSINLGPSTPLHTMELAIRQYQAVACVVSVSVRPEAGSLAAWSSLRKAADGAGCRLVVGGRCVAALEERARLGVHVVGSMTELGAFAAGLVQGSRRPSERLRRQSKTNRR